MKKLKKKESNILTPPDQQDKAGAESELSAVDFPISLLQVQAPA